MERDTGVRSRAALFGHPLHPMIVPFPMAFLVGAFAGDIAYWRTENPLWSSMSTWLIMAGLVMGMLAAVLGFIDFIGIKRVRRGLTGWTHMIGNILVMAISLINLMHRLGDTEGGVLPLGLILSAVVVAILMVTGWLGGELVYRHKIGVIEPPARRFHPAE
jgi:uncharacterized membrane protein